MKTILYIFWLITEMIKSSLEVTKIIWQFPKMKIKPVINFLPTKLNSELSRVIFANSITLTPGTISILIEKDKILVHSLKKEFLSLEKMEKKIMNLRK